MKKEQRFTSRRRLQWWVVFPLAVFSTALASFARLQKHHKSGVDVTWSGVDPESLASCTYEQLDAAFGKPATLSSSQDDVRPEFVEKDKDDKCWHLTDRMLKIPKRAIVNFDSLIPLGAGLNGGVYMAFINLDDSQPPCKVAYKTDLKYTAVCKDVWTRPFSTPWSRTKSCWAAHWIPFRSNMPGELIGGIIFQAFRQHAAEHPQEMLDTSGILPTWAMVPFHEEAADCENGKCNHVPRHVALRHRQHEPSQYPGVLGVIMPLVKIQPLLPSMAHEYTAASMATMLQPAAQGLAYAHELGLTRQNGAEIKNIGFVENDQGHVHAVLYDWGHTALDDNPPTAVDAKCSLGRACNFCQESYFPLPRVGGSHGAKHSRRRTLDCEHLRIMFGTIFDNVQDAATEGQYWKAQMQSNVNCSLSTQSLANVLASASTGRAP